jgi:gas vesicle structural protein
MAEQRSLGGALPPVASILPESEFTLLELADRLLNKGVVLVGEATISVAGVDLVYLGLNLVLTAVENLQPKPAESSGDSGEERSAPLIAPLPSE